MLSITGTGVTAVAALATAVIAVVVAAQLRNRERRLALVDLHAWLTTGETAAARDTIGSLLYSESRFRRTDRPDAIASYFMLIWALQRSRNTFSVYGFSWQESRATKLRFGRRTALREREADSALTWNIAEIADNVDTFYRKFSDAWGVSDRDAWQDISPFVTYILSRR